MSNKKVKYIGHSSGISMPGVGIIQHGDEFTTSTKIAKELLERGDFMEVKELYEQEPVSKPVDRIVPEVTEEKEATETEELELTLDNEEPELDDEEIEIEDD